MLRRAVLLVHAAFLAFTGLSSVSEASTKFFIQQWYPVFLIITPPTMGEEYCDEHVGSLWRRCDTLCISGFMDNVMFEQNGQKMAEIADTNNAYTRIRYCGVYSN